MCGVGECGGVERVRVQDMRMNGKGDYAWAEGAYVDLQNQ